MSFFTKLLIGSILFCVLAVGLGAYLFFNGANLISADNIDIAISGPVSIPGGAPVSFDITVTNNNNVDLQLVDMAVEFPAGATDPKDPTKELSTYRELLGDIPAGGKVKKTVNAIIFGEENLQKQITANITYQVKGSSNSFTKERSYALLINSSPVNLTVDSFKEIISGQEFEIKVSAKSNSQNTLKNTLVTVAYPFGFTFVSSDLKPLPDNASWKLGDIPAGGEKTIVIRGKLQGEDTDTRVFKWSIGAQSLRNQNIIGTEYMSATQEVAISKPFMTVALSVDGGGQSETAIGQFNQPVRVELSWFNNLPNAVSDAQISVKLSGTAYDRNLVQAGQGYYRSSTDEIIWNKQTVPQLGAVGPGEGGSISFAVTPRDAGAGGGKNLTNPVIDIMATVSGRRTQETGVPENVSSAASKQVKIVTMPALSGRVLRVAGPFANTGPIPPQVDKKTTYTIVWTIDNTVNIIKNAQVKATLPPYVTWLGEISPATEDVSFASSSNAITWNAGTIGTNTVANDGRKELYFQIAVEPNIGQANNIPMIVGDATMTATDDFTGATVNASQSYLTTRFSTDPTYREGMETVVK